MHLFLLISLSLHPLQSSENLQVWHFIVLGALQAARPPPSLLLIAKGHEFYQKVSCFSEDPERRSNVSLAVSRLSSHPLRGQNYSTSPPPPLFFFYSSVSKKLLLYYYYLFPHALFAPIRRKMFTIHTLVKKETSTFGFWRRSARQKPAL